MMKEYIVLRSDLRPDLLYFKMWSDKWTLNLMRKRECESNFIKHFILENIRKYFRKT